MSRVRKFLATLRATTVYRMAREVGYVNLPGHTKEDAIKYLLLQANIERWNVDDLKTRFVIDQEDWFDE